MATADSVAALALHEAKSIFPIHAATDGIGCLAVREPFDRWYHPNKCQILGRDFHGALAGLVEIGEELIIVMPAERRGERHIEVCLLEKRHEPRQSARLALMVGVAGAKRCPPCFDHHQSSHCHDTSTPEV